MDVWVNNAGVPTMNRFVDLTDHEWEHVMRVNATGVFLCAQTVVRHMIGHRGGKIMNVASMAGKRGNVPFLAHCRYTVGTTRDPGGRCEGDCLPRLARRGFHHGRGHQRQRGSVEGLNED